MCGIIGVHFKKEAKMLPLVYQGLFALQHRGQESAGAILNHGKNSLENFYWRKVTADKNPVAGLFAKLNNLYDNEFFSGIGHVRYSTAGSAGKLKNAQPFLRKTKFGEVAIAHNGNIH